MSDIKLVKHQGKKEELLDLYRVCFGFSMSAELWDWKYIQNPLSSTDPEIIVAIANGKIVGARPLLLAEMWLRDEIVKTVQPCDTMVHPEHRREGIFSQMNQFALEYAREKDYAFFYNFPNQMSGPGNLKQGWKIVSVAEHLHQLTNPKRVISYKLKNRPLGTVAGFFYDKIIKARPKVTSVSSSLQIKVSDQFTDELKSVDILSNKSIINLVRSESYLRWRFDQHPEYSYKYIMVKRGEDLCGYAAVSVQKRLSGLIYGTIIDYVVKDKDIDCFMVLMNACLIELDKFKCDLITVCAFTQPIFQEKLLKHFGFKSPIKFPYNKVLSKNYFVVRETKEDILKKIDIYNKENWQVTYAYMDTT